MEPRGSPMHTQLCIKLCMWGAETPPTGRSYLVVYDLASGRSNSFRRQWCSFFIILNRTPLREQLMFKDEYTSNIHMFRLRILSKIRIQYFSRSIKVIRGQTRVKSSNKGQIGPIGRNISNTHMFRLRISSRIQI